MIPAHSSGGGGGKGRIFYSLRAKQIAFGFLALFGIAVLFIGEYLEPISYALEYVPAFVATWFDPSRQIVGKWGCIAPCTAENEIRGKGDSLEITDNIIKWAPLKFSDGELTTPAWAGSRGYLTQDRTRIIWIKGDTALNNIWFRRQALKSE
jgi:hypothetical protein